MHAKTGDKRKMIEQDKKEQQSSPSTLKEFFATTSAHGYLHLTKGSTIARLCWAFLVLAALLATTGHVYVLTMEYLKYEYHDVITNKPDVERTFPDVTICDSVGISDYAVHKSGEAITIMRYILSIGKMLLSKTTKQDLADKYSKEIVDGFYSFLNESSSIFANLPSNLTNHVGVQFDSLVANCKFAGLDCDAKHFELYVHPTYINCYTFKSELVNAKHKNKLLGPEFGLSLLLRGEPTLVETYSKNSNIQGTNSLHLHIHPPNTMPFVSSDGLDINPGISTSIEINQKQFIRLGDPYSDCHPEQMVTRLSKEYFMEPNYCLHRCVQDIIRHECNCTSTIFDGVSNNSDDYCDHVEYGENSTLDFSKTMCEIKLLLLWGSIEKPNCERCTWNCRETKYDIRVSQALWPHSAMMGSFIEKYVQSKPKDNPIREYYDYLVDTLNFKDGNKEVNNTSTERRKTSSEYLMEHIGGNESHPLYIPDTLLESKSLVQLQRNWMKESFYRLNIYFSEPFVTVHEQVASFEFYDYWSGIGGCLGLWAGVSVLTIIEFFHFISNVTCKKVESNLLNIIVIK